MIQEARALAIAEKLMHSLEQLIRDNAAARLAAGERELAFLDELKTWLESA